MVEAVRAFMRTASRRSAPATDAIPPSVCSFQAIVPKTADWRSYEVKPVWETPGPVLEPSYDAYVVALRRRSWPSSDSRSRCWDYDRTRALIDGAVQIDGVDPDLS